MVVADVIASLLRHDRQGLTGPGRSYQILAGRSEMCRKFIPVRGRGRMVRQRSDRSSNCRSSRSTPRVTDAWEATQMNEVADSNSAGNTRSGGLVTSADGPVSSPAPKKS
jgi:hypothetical protein